MATLTEPQSTFRVGLGHDVHRLEAGRSLIVGGVRIPHDHGPAGHSDGDVLLHALTDALLGAAGLGDIGEWFPDTAAEWKDADSSQFVTAARDAVRERGWTTGNADCTVFLEAPKLKPHKPTIRANIAALLECPEGCVNVKAKTGERVGPVGRKEAIAADVIILLERGGA